MACRARQRAPNMKVSKKVSRKASQALGKFIGFGGRALDIKMLDRQDLKVAYVPRYATDAQCQYKFTLTRKEGREFILTTADGDEDLPAEENFKELLQVQPWALVDDPTRARSKRGKRRIMQLSVDSIRYMDKSTELMVKLSVPGNRVKKSEMVGMHIQYNQTWCLKTAGPLHIHAKKVIKKRK